LIEDLKILEQDIHAADPIPDKLENTTSFYEINHELTPERALVAALLVRQVLDARAIDTVQIKVKGKTYLRPNAIKYDAIEWLSEEHPEPFPAWTCLWCLAIFHPEAYEAQQKLLKVLEDLGNRKKVHEILTNLTLGSLLNAKTI